MGREMVTSPGAGEGRQSQVPRLVITRMELVNFKSYAGTKSIGPFHKCFSSVVGPNGSGKSNVIDAMLFVFGKKAKQLRLNKVSELIHNSTNHQNLPYAEVSVYFQMIVDLDDENSEPVPGTELVVTRRANRDNSSKYMINGRNSTFTEVTELLKGKGIDLDNNRFLILQGEVEQIAMMKPKAQGPHDEGLLEYLSDIIGCDHYNERIDQASQKVEQLSEERTGKLQHVKIAEKQMSSLEGAKTEAELFIRKESELLQAKVIDLQLCLEENERALVTNKANQAALEKKLEEERAKRADDEAQAKVLEKEFTVHRKAFEKIEKELDSAKEQFAEFERKDVKLREDLKHLKEKLKKLDQKAKKDVQKRAELEKESADAVESIPRLEGEHAQLVADLPAQEKLLDEYKEKAKAEMEQYREKLQAVHGELEPFEKDMSETKARMDVATAERNLLVEKHASAEKAFADASASRTETEARIADTEKEIRTISGSLQQKKADATAARDEEKACQASEAAVSSEVQMLRGRVGELRSARDSEQSRGRISQAFTAAKREGRLPGFLGRLGELGAINAKYDVAISTGCSQLDAFLVDNAATAQACIKILKEQQLGIATFIALDKQQHFQAAMNDPVQTPEHAPRLFDLITFAAERVKPAFWYALRNTLVADNLDQAQRIAYGPDKRFRRVVTLQGQVIESSGTMSGGGKPQSGKMGSRLDKGLGVSDRELETLERQLADKTAQLEEFRARGQAAGTAAERAERELAELEMRLPKAKLELDALRTQLSDLSRRLAGLEAAAHPSEEELERVTQLGQAVTAEEKALAKVEKASAHLRKKAEEIQSQMDNAGGDELKRQKEKVEKLQANIDGTSTEINRLKVLIKTHAKAGERLAKAAEDAEKERVKLTSQMEVVTSELRGLEQEALKVKDSYEKTQEVLESKRGEMESLQREYARCKAVVESFRLGEVDLLTQLEDAAVLVQGAAAKAKALEKALAGVRKKQEQHRTTLDLSEEEAAALLAPPPAEDAAPETQEDVRERIQKLEAELNGMKPNMASIAEYRKKEADYTARVRDLDAVTSARDEARKEHTELRKTRLDEFMAGFNVITMKLKEMYQMITLGGDAELELVDSLDPFSEGIVFSVRPPKKSWKNISNLSGGEKTLSSLALVFALHHYKPTPLYVMDEIDAALDFKNVSIVAHYIKDRTKDAQFIIISLRNNMFELADRLVGIYKTDNCTKSITINPRSFAVAAAT